MSRIAGALLLIGGLGTLAAILLRARPTAEPFDIPLWLPNINAVRTYDWPIEWSARNSLSAGGGLWSGDSPLQRTPGSPSEAFWPGGIASPLSVPVQE